MLGSAEPFDNRKKKNSAKHGLSFFGSNVG